MAFVLNSIIKIGKYTFKGGVHDLVIKKSVNAFVDTAKLTIPGIGSVRNNNLVEVYGSVKTALLFKEGDFVSIDLGYNGDLRNEFRGFVRRVSLSTPLVLDLEGYAWQLRNKPSINQSWKNTTLEEVLTVVIKDTDIVLSPDIPVIRLAYISGANRSPMDFLDFLIHSLLLTVYFDDNVLYVGLEEIRTTLSNTATKIFSNLAEVIYSIGYNTIKTDDLKIKLKDDKKVNVKIKVKGKDGKTTTYQAGDIGGTLHEKIIPYITDSSILQDIANNKLSRMRYDGYEGKLVAFLQPFCKPGWKATIRDKKFDGARAGSYFIHSTEVTFGAKGARRHVHISYRLDKLQLS